MSILIGSNRQLYLAPAALRATGKLFSSAGDSRFERALEIIGPAVGAQYVALVANHHVEGAQTPLFAWLDPTVDVSRNTGAPEWPAFPDSDLPGCIGTMRCYPVKADGHARLALLVAFPTEFESCNVEIHETLAAFADQIEVALKLPMHAGQIEQRIRIDQALVAMSQMLVAADEIDFRRLLQIAGEATGVESAHFVRLPLDVDLIFTGRRGEIDPTLIYRWSQDGAFAVEPVEFTDASSDGDDSAHYMQSLRAGGSVSAVPVLSPDDRLFGYLGFEYGSESPEWRDEDMRVLGILGDMLATYFARKTAEGALQESEDRWRRLVEHHPDPIVLSAEGIIGYVNPAAVNILGAPERNELIGTSLYDFVSAELFDTIERRARTVGAGAVPEPIEHEMIRFDGEERIVQSASVPIKYEGRSFALTVMRDVTAARLAEEGYRTFVETITEAICRIDLDRPVSRVVAVDRQRDHVLEYAYVAECNGVMVELLDRDRSEIEGKTITSVFKTLRPSLVEEFIQRGYRLKNKELTVRRAAQPNRYLVLNAVGTLERGKLSRIWVSCIDVTERVELERSILGALEEQQQKIGRDLHDGVGQLLTGIRMLSQNLAERLQKEEHPNKDAADRVATFAQEASKNIRDIYRGLTPAQLYHEGLSATLSELAHNVDALPTVRCEFLHIGGAEIEDRDTKLHLFRIAQEAVNNALKHASPSKIVIYFGREDDHIILRIHDDGTGMSHDKGRKSMSIGLDSMRYRAGAIGATLDIVPDAESGTTVRCRLPLFR